MGKKILILIFCAVFLLAVNSWADIGDRNIKAYSGKRPFVPGEVIVKFNKPHQFPRQVMSASSSTPSEVKKLFKKSGASILAAGGDRVDEPGVYKLTYKNRDDIYSVAGELKKDPDVDYAEPNYLYQTFVVPNDPDYSSEWGFSKIGAPAAWDAEKGNPDLVIAVIDTGVDYRHPDLAPNIWVNKGEIPGNGVDDDGNGYVDDVHGWNFVDVPQDWVLPGERWGPPDNDPMDFMGHGTLVAGVAAGKPDNRIGIAGAAWNCKIMPLRAGYVGPDYEGYVDLDFAAEAIYYAANNGANIINMSWGCPYDSQFLDEAINYAHSKGCIMVAAAGNVESCDLGQPFYPAACDHVIAVSATNSGDDVCIWNYVIYANFGDFVDICAPGTNILSTLPNDMYYSASGTSMASPIVAGVAALVKSKHMDWTPDQVEARLKETADNIYTENTRGYLQGKLGAGRLNAKRALGNLSMDITYPTPSSIISGSVVVKGSADMENFSDYKLEYSSATSDVWVPIVAQSSKPIDQGVLAIWSVANPDGQYRLRLTVSSTSGESYEYVSGVNFGTDGEVKLSERPKCGPSPFDPPKENFLFYYDLMDAADVDIYVYDISGTLVWQRSFPYDAGTSGKGGSAGENRVFWNGENGFGETLGNGAYVYMIVANDSGLRKVIGRGKFAVVKS